MNSEEGKEKADLLRSARRREKKKEGGRSPLIGERKGSGKEPDCPVTEARKGKDLPPQKNKRRAPLDGRGKRERNAAAEPSFGNSFPKKRGGSSRLDGEREVV